MNTTIQLFVLAACLLACTARAAGFGELDATTFNGALNRAETMPRLHSILISHEDELVVERYFNGIRQNDTANVKSVSKTIMSALVGIAIDQGHIPDIDQPIGDYFSDVLGSPEQAPKRDITVPK